MRLNHFLQYFLLICEKMSLLSWFWKDSCSVFDPIPLVNENNDHFCTFIVKKCHFPCVSYACFIFNLKSFPFGFTFSFNNFIWIIKKYHFPCDFDALFFIFLKIFIFPLICKYIFFNRDFKGKIEIVKNYKLWCPKVPRKSVRQLETDFRSPDFPIFFGFCLIYLEKTKFFKILFHLPRENENYNET